VLGAPRSVLLRIGLEKAYDWPEEGGVYHLVPLLARAEECV